MPRGDQQEIPGTPAPESAAAETRLNNAVLRVQEAEAELRNARKEERSARAEVARLGRLKGR